MARKNKSESFPDKSGTPLARLRGSVKKYERPTEPVWEEYFDSEGVSDDFMFQRDQPKPEEPD